MVSNKRYDLVLMDHQVRAIAASLQISRTNRIISHAQMDGMDGLETTVKMRQSDNPNISGLKIIALTASALKGDQEKFIASGADGYLSKVSLVRRRNGPFPRAMTDSLLVLFSSLSVPQCSKLRFSKPSRRDRRLGNLRRPTRPTKTRRPRPDSTSAAKATKSGTLQSHLSTLTTTPPWIVDDLHTPRTITKQGPRPRSTAV